MKYLFALYPMTVKAAACCVRTPDPAPCKQQNIQCMKAIKVHCFGDESRLCLETTKVPKPRCDEVLIKVKAAGVNPIEAAIRAGQFMADTVKLAYIPGTDVAGVVEEVGKDVTKFRKGDRVFTARANGSYAEYATACEGHIGWLSCSLSFEQGAALGIPYHAAFKALNILAKAIPGETVLVQGASGGVGIAVVEFAKAQGLRVLGTAGTPEGMNLVKKHGAEKVFNHYEDCYEKQIIEYTRCKGVDIIIDMKAECNLPRDLEILNVNGRLVVVGGRGKSNVNPATIKNKQVKIIGLNIFNSSEEEWRIMMKAVEAGQTSGTINPYVNKVYALSEAQDAHRTVARNKGALGKLIIDTEKVCD